MNNSVEVVSDGLLLTMDVIPLKCGDHDNT
jgi:hypothetical protein